MTSLQQGPVTVHVPASTSNLGAGFDCVGLAVDSWLTATARLDGSVNAHPRVERGGTLGTIGCPPERDLLVSGFRAACAAARRATPAGLAIAASSEIPIARGLGSSAAAVVAGAALANQLLGLGLDAFGIAEAATAVEGHPDNVCPAVFGGATLALEHEGRFIVSPLEIHPTLAFVFAVPDFVVETRRARSALPNVVPHVTAVHAAAKGAALVRGLAAADAALLAAALDDVLHVPHRRALVRGYDAVVSAARGAGAFGATLRGSGSTIVDVTSRELGAAVAQAMIDTWHSMGVTAEALFGTERVRGLDFSSPAP